MAPLRTRRRKKRRIRIIVVSVFAVIVAVVIVLVVNGSNNPSTPQATPTPASTAQATSVATPSATLTPEPTVTPTTTPDASTTQSTPAVTFDPDLILKEGVRSEDVFNLQVRLIELGYLDIDVPTETFGEKTTEAVIRFQQDNDLGSDGIAGEQTLTALFSPDTLHASEHSGTTADDNADDAEDEGANQEEPA